MKILVFLAFLMIVAIVSSADAQLAMEANQHVFQSLKIELEAVHDGDQKIRKQLETAPDSMELIHQMETSDTANLKKVKVILDKHGWLGPDQVGSKASEAIFLVIQHADIETQEKYLPVMRVAVKEKKARGSSLAMLEDRVRMRRGEKQIYGTQVRINEESHKYELSALEDPKNVDKRRAEVGLGPLATYLAKWGVILQ